MIRERVPGAVRILEESRTFQEALTRIRAEVDPRATGDNLCKAFKSAGFERPSFYVNRPPAVKPFIAPVVQHPASGPLSKILIVPDVHVPYHHELSWRCLLETARGWMPDAAVILGDFGEFYQVSSHPKDPARVLSFDDEVAAVDNEMTRFSNLCIPRVIFCCGNHETRYDRYINSNAPALARMRGGAEELLDVKRFGWEWVPYGHHATIGKLNFMHDVGHAGMYAAKQSVAAFGGNIIFGHTHRAGAHYESTVNGDRHVGWTMGWLGDPECIDYRHRARVLRESQHGFGVAYVENATGLGWVNFVPVIDGRAVVDGVMYDGRMYDLGEAA